MFRLFSQTSLAKTRTKFSKFILWHNMFQSSDPDHMLNKTMIFWRGWWRWLWLRWGWWWNQDNETIHWTGPLCPAGSLFWWHFPVCHQFAPFVNFLFNNLYFRSYYSFIIILFNNICSQLFEKKLKGYKTCCIVHHTLKCRMKNTFGFLLEYFFL